MRWTTWTGAVGLLLAAALVVAGSGCGQGDKKGDEPKQAKNKQPGTGAKKTADDSDTWWCKEHGIPEHVCGMCSAEYAKQCQAKGDWCKEHDRPESQCFICHPEYEAKFKAMYEDRYGKEPPPREKEEAEKAKGKGK